MTKLDIATCQLIENVLTLNSVIGGVNSLSNVYVFMLQLKCAKKNTPNSVCERWLI